MASDNLSRVWENDCLKLNQVGYTAANGTPYVLGNSVIEGIVGNGTIPASSCISCHANASFAPTGKPTASANAMLPFKRSESRSQEFLPGHGSSLLFLVSCKCQNSERPLLWHMNLPGSSDRSGCRFSRSTSSRLRHIPMSVRS